MAVELKAGVQAFRLIVLACLVLMLAGCPRIAQISIYNNTKDVIEVDISGLKETVKPGASQTIQFTGAEILVKFGGESWQYKRLIPHAGEDGPYFDGTLRVQINSDSKVYAVPVGKTAPLDHFENQPEGFPLSPKATGIDD